MQKSGSFKGTLSKFPVPALSKEKVSPGDFRD